MNLDQAESKDTLRLSKLFREAKIIQLDTCAQALIGEVYQAAVTDKYIFILDRHISKSMLMFNKQGNFIRKIGNFGTGKGEYFSPDDFALDKQKQRIYILDGRSKRIHEYNYTTGEYLTSIDIPLLSSYLLYDKGIFYIDCSQQGEEYLMYKTSINGKQAEYLFSPEGHNKGVDYMTANQDRVFLSKFSHSPKLTYVFMDTVFDISNQNIYPYLVLQSKDMITEKDLKNLDIIKNPLDIIKLFQKDKYYDLQTYMEKEDFIFFQMQRKSKAYPFYYDKTAKQLNKYKLLYEDMLSDGMEFRLMGLRFGSSDDKGVCFYLSPNRVNMLKQMKGVKLNIDKEENFNGVIFYYTYKE